MSAAGIIPTDLVATVADLKRRVTVVVKQATAVVLFLGLWYRVGNFFLAVLVAAGLVGMVLAVLHVYTFGRWLPGRRRALVEAGRLVPGLRKLWRGYRAERARLAYLDKQWPVACLSQGLTGPGKGIPALFDVRPTLDNSVTARVASSRMGVDPEDIAAASVRIAKTVGCEVVRVRETTPGCADLTFSWTNALAKDLPLSQLPPSAPGTLAYGRREDGTAATVYQHQSVLIGGMTRRGKSVLCKALIADLIRKQVPVDLYIADTRDGVELSEFEAAAQHGRRTASGLRVARYEMTADGAAAMVEEMVRVKRARGLEMRKPGRGKQHQPTLAEPLVIGIFDETLPLHAMLKDGTKSPAGEIGFSGAAAGCALWLNAQIGHAAVLGQLRELIPQRVCFATPTTDVTDTILGKGAATAGAACDKLGDRKGLGWSGADSEAVPQPFRSALVTDAQAELLPEGKIPAMPPAFTVPEVPAEAAVRPPLPVRVRALALACRARLTALWAVLVAWVKSALVGAAVALDLFRAAVVGSHD